MLDETVDVAASGHMGVYRSTYREDSLHDGVPFTHDGNYLAGFRRDPDGMWASSLVGDQLAIAIA